MKRLISAEDIDDIEAGLNIESAKSAKRQLRKPLLQAYDTHKTSVLYEGKEESQEEKQKILTWKKDLLDLKSDAIKNVPKQIAYYMR